MKRLAALLTLIILLAAAISLPALAGSQDFTLVNKTGVDIYKLYIAPTDSDDWESEMLQGDVFKDGESLNITFDSRSETFWDIMVVDSEGTEITFEKINLKQTAKIILYFDGEEAWAECK
ncbi:MAG: hypothetical protein ACM3X6_00140 [Patescibacteria group bacterium]